MGLQQSIWQWVQTLPKWQSDLVRRLSAETDLAPGDLEEVKTNLLADCGLADAAANHPPVRAQLSGIPADAPPSGSVRILCLREAKNVGAIEPGEELAFSRDGLTVIYGDNASGKSSYARLLKQACRAVDTSTRILSNVYNLAGPVGEATIDYEEAGQKKSLYRKVNTAPEPILTTVSIFDAASAALYTGAENEVAYIPSGLSLFERLAKVQNLLRQRLEEEIVQLGSKTPSFKDSEFSQTTSVTGVLNALSSTTSEDDIKSLATFGPAEESRLRELATTLATIEAVDPKRLAQDYRRKSLELASFREQVSAVASALSDTAIQQLRVSDSDAEAATEASRLASAEAFENEPVKGVGSDAWKFLWESARKFSTEYAYPGQEFPPTADGSYCVLCHQPLLDDARKRLLRFEAFVRDNAAKGARVASLKRNGFSQQMLNAPISVLGSTPTRRLIDDQFPEVGNSVSALEQSALIRLEQVKTALETHTWPIVQDLTESPEGRLAVLVRVCEEEAIKYQGMDQPASKEAVQKEVAELQARRQLKARVADVLTHVQNLKQIDMLRKAQRHLATASITSKMNEFTAQVVTDALRLRLQAELKALSCGHIAVKLDTRGVKGKTNASLQLREPKQAAKVQEILSEGEQKAVALAFFFAEIGAAPHDGGIILDDPVSSLDHQRRSHIADRLAAESKFRQVIVFTHDLVFLHQLVTRVEGVRIVTIRRAADKIGLVAAELPWRARKVNARIGTLKNDLHTLCGLEAKGSDQYSSQAKLWVENLRETWEQVTEERLFNGVVQRFNPAVQTQRLKKVKQQFTVEVAEEIMAGMTGTSEWVHDQAPAVNCPLPTTVELKTALSRLEQVVAKLPPD